MRRIRLVGWMSAATVSVIALALAGTAAAKVLRVGTYHGIKGQYRSIQKAVDAAKPGDFILVAPGDYKTHSSRAPKGEPQFRAGVLVTTPRLIIRGMSRTGVVVDGTSKGSACNRKAANQNFGAAYGGGQSGLNGIEIWKANNVWVQNLTACNFLNGTGDTGNEVWWNGGADGGHIDGRGYVGSYLTATSTFYNGETTAAAYGLFTSDWTGGVFNQDYASNFNDSGYYIGACAKRCDQVMKNSQAEYNALGYSGTNSGGPMLFEYNRFDHNEDGFDTNAQNNSDWPSPQNGGCPKGIKPQIKGAQTCWIFYKNLLDNNNNPNVPAAGAAAAGPVGTGASIEGRNDTFMDNTFKDNNSWGIVFQPYPDTGTPPSDVTAAHKACAGGVKNFYFAGQNINCLYDDWGNRLIGNTFTHNGSFGNKTNGDFAETTFTGGHAINCYRGNKDTSGHLTSSPSNLEKTNGTCGKHTSTNDENAPFVGEALCDTQALGAGVGCGPTDHYPRETKVVMHKLPKHLSSMSNPCTGVPKNPWCKAPKHSHARA